MHLRWLLRSAFVAFVCLTVAVPTTASAGLLEGGPGFPGITLTTPNPNPTSGTNGTLVATTAIDVTGTSLYIQIFDLGYGGDPLATCNTGTTCVASVPDPHLSPNDIAEYTATIGPYRSNYWSSNTQSAESTDVVLFWNGYISVASDACTAPTLTVVDGYVGAVYERLRVEQLSPTLFMVCYRVDDEGLYYAGGSVMLTDNAPFVSTPTVDSNAQACSTTAGNTVPGPHPAVAGTLLNAPLLIDSYASSDSLWFCLQYGSEQERLNVPVPGGGTPSAQYFLDDSETPPAAAAPPSNYPSSTCQTSGGTAATKVADVSTSGGWAYAYAWEPSLGTMDVCARVQGAVNAGGLLSISVPSTPGLPNPGLTPVVSVSTDVSPCSLVVADLTSPTPALFAVSQPGANPATVCIGVGGTREAITLGVAGSPTLGPPPNVAPPSFSPDPGTP